MADSSGSLGAKLVLRISAICELCCQLSFDAINAPLELCNSNVGLESTPTIPLADKDGPIARRRIRLDCVPEITNPPIKTSSFVPTFKRVEILMRRLAVGGCELDGVP